MSVLDLFRTTVVSTSLRSPAPVEPAPPGRATRRTTARRPRLVDVDTLTRDQANRLLDEVAARFPDAPFDYACRIYDRAAADIERGGRSRVDANLRDGDEHRARAGMPAWWQR